MASLTASLDNPHANSGKNKGRGAWDPGGAGGGGGGGPGAGGDGAGGGPGACGRRVAAALRAAECLRPCARPAPPWSVGCGRRSPAGGAGSGGGDERHWRGWRGACTRTHAAGLGGSAPARGAGRGRARRWRGRRVSHCPVPASLQPPGAPHASRHLGVGSGAGARGGPGAPHSGADLERVAGLGLLLLGCFSSCGLRAGERRRGWGAGGGPTSPTGISAVSLGPGWDVRHRAECSGRGCRRPPGARLRPLEGSGAEGRGGRVCKCCALAFPLPPPPSRVLAWVPRGPAATVNRAWMLFT